MVNASRLATLTVAFAAPAAIRRPSSSATTIGLRTCPRLSPRRLSPRATLPPPLRPANIVPLSAAAAYYTRLFVFPPIPLHPLQSLREAIDLSLNFGYLLPLVFPSSAPVLHPFIEAIFHVVVSWAILLFAFASLDDTSPPPRPRLTPFLAVALFLTNLIYLPYLAIRQPLQSPPSPDTRRAQCDSLSRVTAVAESPALPLTALSLVAVSVPWALLARPQFGDLSARTASFLHLAAHQDILAYSFLLDAFVFALFQSALVPDDAARRSWSSPAIRDLAVSSARFIPFFGLAYYLLQRARHAPLK